MNAAVRECNVEFGAVRASSQPMDRFSCSRTLRTDLIHASLDPNSGGDPFDSENVPE
jgi:hypothetical protein